MMRVSGVLLHRWRIRPAMDFTSTRAFSIASKSHPNPTLRATRRCTVGKVNRRSWNDSLQALAHYKAKNGDCNVPQRYKNDRALGDWVMKQRMWKAKLTPERKALLDAIGFHWETGDERQNRMWEEKYQRLKAYHNETGDCRVPRIYEADPALGNWVARQRKLEKGKRILPARKKLLDELGFTWSTRSLHVQLINETNEKRWEAQFEKLVEFKKEWGHCLVPQHYDVDPILARWVDRQRHRAHHNKILPERKKRLDELGFVWEQFPDDKNSLLAKRWDVMFDRLLDYRDANGNLDVSPKFSQHGLGIWVSFQRRKRRRGQLEPWKEARLNEVGFRWTTRHNWQDRFRQLLQFQQENGHCRISRAHNTKLWEWTLLQRRRQKAGKLKAERWKELESIGFEVGSEEDA